MASAPFNPVERNLFISAFGISTNNLSRYNVDNIEECILASGAMVDGRIFSGFPRYLIQNTSFENGSYLGLLSESTAALSIYPDKRYASFFMSTCGNTDPLQSLEPIIYLLEPAKAEIRMFTSSSIEGNSDDESFWKFFEMDKVPYFYSLENKEKDVNGIYFDLTSKKEIVKSIEVSEEEDPVQKCMFISMYGVPNTMLNDISKKDIILELQSPLSLLNRRRNSLLYKEFDPITKSNSCYMAGASYVAELNRGTVAYHITPESNYVSLFVSIAGNQTPFSCLKDVMNKFAPKKAEVRFFVSSSLNKVDSIPYGQTGEEFLDLFEEKETPEGYEMTSIERGARELYFDLFKEQ